MGGGDGGHRAPWLAEVGGVECYVVMMADAWQISSSSDRFVVIRYDLH
jgi:hypothetical protein